MGMVGGGAGAFIGDLHRKAAALDGQIQLVCGAFSRSKENNQATAQALYLNTDRVYDSWQEMLELERSKPSAERMQMLSIVTPNDLHFPIAKAALEAGFHVMSDKPATCTLAEAYELEKVAGASSGLYGLTHTYMGYPMIKEARARVLAGEIGPIRKVFVDYPQGWLSSALEADGQKQAAWRTDPARSGPSGCMGDIGTHAATLVKYILDDQIDQVCADLSIFVENRALDDDGAVLLRMKKGAKGVLTASQVCNGEENNLSIRVYGETGGLEWAHSDPNTLWLKRQGEAPQKLRAGTDQSYLSGFTQAHLRTPAGHPEGFIEAFANIYRNFAAAISAHETGQKPDPQLDYPTIHDGVASLEFIDAILENNTSSEKWTKVGK